MNISGKIENQRGATLLEAMIAIVILTIGIFAAMSMQVRAIGASSSALNRTDANNVALSLLETFKGIDFNNSNLTQTTASPDALVRGDGDDTTFTAATFPEMQALIQQPAGSAAGTIIDQAGITYQLSWDVQDIVLTGGGTHKTIRVYMTWNSLMGTNSLEMTTIKYNNISM